MDKSEDLCSKIEKENEPLSSLSLPVFVNKELRELQGILKDEKKSEIVHMLTRGYPAEVAEINFAESIVTLNVRGKPQFKVGDSVGIIDDSKKELEEKIRYLGDVISVRENLVTILLASIFPLSEGESIKIVDYQPLISYDLQLSLLNVLLGDQPIIAVGVFNTSAIKLVFGDLKQRELKREEKVNGEVTKGLDESQVEVVKSALALNDNEVLLVTGPPGTGKTTVISRIVEGLLKKGEQKILVASFTNRAVDNAIEKLDKDIAVRIGKPDKVLSSVTSYLLDSKVRENLGDRLKNVEDTIDYIKRVIERIKNVNSERAKEELKMWQNMLAEKIEERNRMISKEIGKILKEAKVIGSTLFASQLGLLSSICFDTVIIDEASQALVTQALLAMVKARKWIIIGDEKQLLPIFNKDDIEIERRYGIFTRLLQKYGNRNLMLTHHYRSHKDIIGFSSIYAYNNKLKAENNSLLKMKESTYEFLNPDKPIVFIHVNGRDEKDERSGSRFNEREAEVIAEIVKELLICEVKHTQIGIITPYNKQKEKIEDKLKERNIEPRTVEIGTVDSFQGREKDVIIYSVTATGGHSLTHFASKPNRLNVAVTRAIKKLIVVGNATSIEGNRNNFDLLTLMYGDFGKCNLYSLLNYCYERNAVYDWESGKAIIKQIYS